MHLAAATTLPTDVRQLREQIAKYLPPKTRLPHRRHAIDRRTTGPTEYAYKILGAVFYSLQFESHWQQFEVLSTV